jgi:hypothetical protein
MGFYLNQGSQIGPFMASASVIQWDLPVLILVGFYFCMKLGTCWKCQIIVLPIVLPLLIINQLYCCLVAAAAAAAMHRYATKLSA